MSVGRPRDPYTYTHNDKQNLSVPQRPLIHIITINHQLKLITDLGHGVVGRVGFPERGGDEAAVEVDCVWWMDRFGLWVESVGFGWIGWGGPIHARICGGTQAKNQSVNPSIHPST